MVHHDDYERTVEELGETLVANEMLQVEVEAWKHTASRALKLLNALVRSPHNAELMARSEALLRELGVDPKVELEELLRKPS